MHKGAKVDDILIRFENPRLLSDEGGQKVVYTIEIQESELAVLKIGYYSSRSSLERIIREVEILRKLESKYFPRNYGFEIVDRERYFILEEYLKGITLKECITEFSSEQEALLLIIELVTAISILWDNRIVHRDLKPQNIIITDNGPRIIDLGIARSLDSTSITNTLAPSGPGTPAYASPEQIENRKRDIDFRSDQFNLGIIFAQLLLEGYHPFSPELVGNTNSILENIIAGNWAKNVISQRISPALLSVITRLLGHEPYQRFRRVEELQLRLSEIARR
jgi:eukaryotic-like serine/threonine-protein kinase